MTKVNFPDKTHSEYDSEFFEMGAECAERFGPMWLVINMAIRDAVTHAGLDESHYAVRWLCFRIARQICYKLQEMESD